MNRPTTRRPLPETNLDQITLLDRHQVAARLGIGLWTLNRWVQAGILPRPLKLTDSSYRWRASDIAAWLDQLARMPHVPAKLRGKAAQWHQPKPTLIRIRLRDCGDAPP
jgi:predicted DNA-binding transcriptional regulator AlpA